MAALLTVLYNDTSLQICSDDLFGPAIQNCGAGLLRGGFDFTLLFEQSILSILPSALLLLAFPLRGWQLVNQPRKVRRDWTYGCKLGAIAVYTALQLTLLVLWAKSSIIRTRVSIAAATLDLLDAAALFALSYGEHTRSIRPSSLISIYLLFSLLFDIVQCRTLWLISGAQAIAAVWSASVGIKVCLLLLEASGKQRILMPRWRSASPEALSGIFSRGFFWWVNELMGKGWRGILKLENLYAVDSELESKSLLSRFQKIWSSSKTRDKYALEFALLKTFKWQLLVTVFPRLCLMGFKFAQPFLINTVTSYLGQPPNSESANVGYGLIAATGLIYIGLAVTNGVFNHQTYRVVTACRGVLTSMVFAKTLTISSTVASAAGASSLGLISTDIPQVCATLVTVHDYWASPIEAGIAFWLLERQLGVACVIPGILAIACFCGTTYISGWMAPRQKRWSAAVQARIKTTAAILGNMKEVKLLGLTDRWSHDIQQLRENELEVFKSFRMMTVYTNCIAEVMSHIAPVATFGVFVLTANYKNERLFTVATAFTSLSLITLLYAPLTLFFHAIVRFGVTHGSLQRIQTFFNSEDRISESIVASDEHDYPQESSSSNDIELENLAPNRPRMQHSDGEHVLTMKEADFSYKNDTPPTLKDINLQIRKSTLNLVIGKVGAGKSTLLRAMLGELLLKTGTSNRSFDTAGYCDHQSWLVNDTVQNNIIGESRFDSRLYEAVIKACALDVDLAQFPQGDQTLIGSKGITLSGGQKQRVTLARAVYSQNHVMIIDDVLSGLDIATEELVWDRVFGPQGLLRQHAMTVILATHAVHHIRDADNVIVIGDQTILQQGSFNDLNTQSGYVQDLLLEEQHEREKQKDSEPEALTTKKPVTTSAAEAAAAAQSNDLARQTGDMSLYSYYLKSAGWRDSLIYLCLSSIFTFTNYFPQVWLRWWAESETADPGGKTRMYFGVYAMFGVVALFLMGVCFWYFLVWIVPKTCNKLHYILLKTVMSAPLSFFVTTDTGTTLTRFSQDMTLLDMALPIAAFLTLGFLMTALASAILITVGSKYLAIAIPLVLLILYCIQKFYLRTSRQIRHIDLEAKSPLYSQFLETFSGILTVRAFGWSSAALDAHFRLLDISQRPYYLLFCIQRWLGIVLDLLVAGIAVLIVVFAVQLRNSTSAGAIGISLLNILNFSTILTQLVTQWTSLETSLGAIARLRDFEKDTPRERDPGNEIHDENETVPAAWPEKGMIEIQNLTASYSSHPSISSSEQPPVLRNISLLIPPAQKLALTGRTGSGKSSLLLTLTRLLEPSSGRILIDGVDISTVPLSILRRRIVFLPQDPVLFPGSLRFNAAPWGSSSVAAMGDGVGLGKSKGAGGADIEAGFERVPADDEVVRALEAVSLWPVFTSHFSASSPSPSSPSPTAPTNSPPSPPPSAAEILSLDLHTSSLPPLSTGQKQLFCLARAILSRSSSSSSSPPAVGIGEGQKGGGILILDEATANVDSQTERLMHGVIRKEFKGWTVVGVTHHLLGAQKGGGEDGEEGGSGAGAGAGTGEGRFYDRVVVMDGGRLVE